MPEYLSERKRKVSIGIPEYTENNIVLDITGKGYITNNLGIGTTNPTSKLTFGTSSLGTLPTETSLRLYDVSDETGNLISYGFGVNNDSDIGGLLTYLDIVTNDESTGGIRFFVGDPNISSSLRERVSIGTDGVYIKNVPLNIETSLSITGGITANSLNINGLQVINEYLELFNIHGLDQITSDTISFSIANNPKTFTNLEVLGNTTLIDGPFLFRRLELTGTDNQLFEVNSGAYFSGSIGIGITNTTEKLSVDGNILISNRILQGTSVSYTNATQPSSIHSDLSISSYRFVEYSIQANQGDNFQFTKILALHDGVSVYTTEYGNVYNNFSMGEYDVEILGDNLSLIVSPNIDSEIRYAISFIATKIE